VNSVHPTAQLLGDVTLGSGNTIGPLAVIIGPVRIGDDNWIGTGAMIGAPPEVRGWQHPTDAMAPSSGRGIEIGDRNTIREYVQIHQGWQDVTRVGDETFIMNQCYLGHDTQVEDQVTMASSVLLAGHVRIGLAANIGLGSVVHQRCYIGDGAMVGMGSVVTRDLPPFSRAFGSPARVQGANRIGMERSGIPGSTIDAVSRAYGGTVDDEVTRELASEAGLSSSIAHWLMFGRRER
jgi:UDP-N-acetylglucosamine acyltransferase